MTLDINDGEEAVVQSSDAALSATWEQPVQGPWVGIRGRYAGCRPAWLGWEEKGE